MKSYLKILNEIYKLKEIPNLRVWCWENACGERVGSLFQSHEAAIRYAEARVMHYGTEYSGVIMEDESVSNKKAY